MGRIEQWIAFSLHTQRPWVQSRVFTKFLMLPRLIDGNAALSSGQQRLNDVDQTHLVLWLVASWYYKKTKDVNQGSRIGTVGRAAASDTNVPGSHPTFFKFMLSP